MREWRRPRSPLGQRCWTLHPSISSEVNPQPLFLDYKSLPPVITYYRRHGNWSINSTSTSKAENELRAVQTMCGDGSPTSYETTMRAPKLPNPPSVALEDVLVPAISALSTLALIMILASAAIVLVQTWNGFCGGRRDGGEDGYLDNNDRRALTQLSLRYCKIILYYTIRIRDYKSDKKNNIPERANSRGHQALCRRRCQWPRRTSSHSWTRILPSSSWSEPGAKTSPIPSRRRSFLAEKSSMELQGCDNQGLAKSSSHYMYGVLHS